MKRCRTLLAALTCVLLAGAPAHPLAATPPARATLAEPVLGETALADPILVGATALQAPGALNAKPDAGGLTPCLLTCYLGPRVGTEYNEGRGVATQEWIALFFFPARIVGAIQAYRGTTMSEWAKERDLDTKPIPPGRGNVESPGGAAACFIAFCVGPRPAFERNEGRRLRRKEVLLFVPVVNVIMTVVMGLEAYNGKTMTQIAQDEGLDS